MNRIRRWVIGIGISLAASLVVLWGIDPQRLLGAFWRAQYGYLIPLVLVLILGLVARAFAWRTLLGGRVELRRVFNAINVGYLLNALMPFRVGELGRALLVSTDGKVRVEEGLGTIVIERLLDTLITFAALLISLPLIIIPAWAQSLSWFVGSFLLAILLAAFFLTKMKPLVLRVAEHLFSRLGMGRMVSLSEGFINGLESVTQPSKIGRAGLWSLAAWGAVWIQMWLLLALVGVPVSPAALLFVPAVAAFGSALPPSPGAIGVFEAAAVAGLLVFGYERETALTVAVLWHGVQLLTTGLLGGLGLAHEGRTLADLARRIQLQLRPRNSGGSA